MVTLRSGSLASNFLRRSVMTSPSLPSEYHVMRNWVCANADGGNDTSDTDTSDTKMAAIDISWRTTINPSRNLPAWAICCSILQPHLCLARDDNKYHRGSLGLVRVLAAQRAHLLPPLTS